MFEIKTIDLKFQGRQKVIASYLIESSDGLIMVESGPQSVVKNSLEGLRALGYAASDVKYVLLTHIHLDHGGAAGWWAQQGAHIYVHHVGAPHLIDPSRLMRSATRIYGDQMDTLWGNMIPVPQNRLTSLRDEDALELGGVQIQVLDTPGHAYHHMSYLLGNRYAFTGDVGGATVPGYRVVDAATPPPEFHLEAWHASIERLLALSLEKIYLTHFGGVEDVTAHLTNLKQLLADAADFVKIRWADGMESAQIVHEYGEWYRQRMFGVGLPEDVFETLAMSNQPMMSVNGIARYWRKRSEQA